MLYFLDNYKLEPLTDFERKFATENHNLVYDFLHRHGYSLENYYDVAIFGFLKAVQIYNRREDLRNKYAFPFISQEEVKEMRKNKVSLSIIRRDSQGKIKRKSYSEDTRKLIYLHAGRRCELCGRKILLEDMTIDHITPLAMGGEDDVENLSCTCYPCNLFKGNILPSDFMERITDCPIPHLIDT